MVEAHEVGDACTMIILHHFYGNGVGGSRLDTK